MVRKFNQYLPDARWQKLIDGCYQVINSAASIIQDPASGQVFNGVGLLPDWLFIDNTGNIYFNGDAFSNPAVTISSWDAFRTAWRVYFDWDFTHGAEGRAQNYLQQLASFYQQENLASRPIYASYYYSGLPAVNYTSPVASGVPLLSAFLDITQPIDVQTGLVQTALAYLLKSAPTNPPTNNQFSGPDTFQDFGSYGYFLAPGDTLRYYINSWGMLGLLIAYYTPAP